MSLPEYDNVAKWVSLFRRMPFWLKAFVTVLIVSVISIWIYTRFGPLRELRLQNTSLKQDLEQAKSEVNKLTDRKNELHRENLYLKQIMEPIQKKAELLYPELETAAAVAKLAEDLQNVRSLATRDVYKTLAENQKKKLIESLSALRTQYAFIAPSVTILLQQGSSSRAKVANDLKQYLDTSEFKTALDPVMVFYSGMPPDISIKFNPEDMQFVQQFAAVVGTFFINKQFSGIPRDKFSRGHLEITINGDPLFADSGIVTFR